MPIHRIEWNSAIYGFPAMGVYHIKDNYMQGRREGGFQGFQETP